MKGETMAKTEQAKQAPAKVDDDISPCMKYFWRPIQYLFGIAISVYAVFIILYGLFNGYNGTRDFLHPAVTLIFLVLLITALAFCEGTQIALMLLEKIPARDLPDNICCAARVRRTHELAQNNTEKYLVGRQIFTTGIVFLIAKLIYMKPEFAPFCADTLGWFGNRVLLEIFVYFGLAGSLTVLAFGQLLPQLIVTAMPVLQYQLFPTYEIIVIQLFFERLGVGYMANICRQFTIWLCKIEEDAFGVGSGVVISAEKDAVQDAEISGFVKFWVNVPQWNVYLQYAIGFLVFLGGCFLTVWNVVTGYSDFTRIEWELSDTEGFCKDSTGLQLTDFTSAEECAGEGTWVGAKIAPITDDDGLWKPLEGDIPVWVQLAIFIPISNILMGFLEGSQIAILALEKAPPRTVKRVHRAAYFGHKLSQQGENVRRYLLGRQFLVVFVDFIAAHTMGLGGLMILVPVSQLYPQLIAASNPMWFLGTWGSRFILLMALTMEFFGFCHFSWFLFITFTVIRKCFRTGEEGDVIGSVGQALNIDDPTNVVFDANPDEEQGDAEFKDVQELQSVIIQQKKEIREKQARIDQLEAGQV